MPLFGLPRIYKNREDMAKIEQLHESKYNGFTIYTGSLGENPKNDAPAIIREFVKKDRAPFIHARNIKLMGNGDFHESAHLSSAGSLDMYEIMKALYDAGFVRIMEVISGVSRVASAMFSTTGSWVLPT